jgi:hypothetical protein
LSVPVYEQLWLSGKAGNAWEDDYVLWLEMLVVLLQ